jgi:surfactin synthase thioesterase subunit
MCDVPLRLPGMMLDGRAFAAQIRALGEGRQVFVADLSGASTIDGMAARVLSSAPSVFAAAGLSMGGIVALETRRRDRGNRTLIDLVLAMGIAAGPDTFRRQSLSLRDRADSLQTRVEIACPSLVLCGREDLPGRTH